jgi:hypothetical protein
MPFVRTFKLIIIGLITVLAGTSLYVSVMVDFASPPDVNAHFSHKKIPWKIRIQRQGKIMSPKSVDASRLNESKAQAEEKKKESILSTPAKMKKQRQNISFPTTMSAGPASPSVEVNSHLQLCEMLSKNALNNTKLQLGNGRCTSGSTGNQLAHVYMTELISIAGNASFFRTDNCRRQQNSIQAFFPSDNNGKLDRRTQSSTTWQSLCRECNTVYPHLCKNGINQMAPAIRHDLQHAAHQWLARQGAGAQRDDAVIHFRCGDILTEKSQTKYGISSYHLYDQFLKDASIQTIGIVTAPLGPKSGRAHERKHAKTCQALVNDMVSYLKQKYPSTTVSVRNDATETVVSAYSRMILASRTLCDSSTFCVFPAIATTGQGYVTESNALYPWIQKVEKAQQNLNILNRTHFLSSGQISSEGLGAQDIIAWRRAPLSPTRNSKSRFKIWL